MLTSRLWFFLREPVIIIAMLEVNEHAGCASYPCLVFIFVSSYRFCHQLDFSTSGALCVALSKEAAGRAYKCFKERTVTKAYMALVSTTSVIYVNVRQTSKWKVNAHRGLLINLPKDWGPVHTKAFAWRFSNAKKQWPLFSMAQFTLKHLHLNGALKVWHAAFLAKHSANASQCKSMEAPRKCYGGNGPLGVLSGDF